MADETQRLNKYVDKLVPEDVLMPAVSITATQYRCNIAKQEKDPKKREEKCRNVWENRLHNLPEKDDPNYEKACKIMFNCTECMCKNYKGGEEWMRHYLVTAQKLE